MIFSCFTVEEKCGNLVVHFYQIVFRPEFLNLGNLKMGELEFPEFPVAGWGILDIEIHPSSKLRDTALDKPIPLNPIYRFLPVEWVSESTEPISVVVSSSIPSDGPISSSAWWIGLLCSSPLLPPVAHLEEQVSTGGTQGAPTPSDPMNQERNPKAPRAGSFSSASFQSPQFPVFASERELWAEQTGGPGCPWNGGNCYSPLSWKMFPGQKSWGGNEALNARPETDSIVAWTLILKPGFRFPWFSAMTLWLRNSPARNSEEKGKVRTRRKEEKANAQLSSVGATPVFQSRDYLGHFHEFRAFYLNISVLCL